MLLTSISIIEVGENSDAIEEKIKSFGFWRLEESFWCGG